jgi:hypothetical protein
MAITRQKFLKHLAFVMSGSAIAPAAVETPIPGDRWVCLYVVDGYDFAIIKMKIYLT